MKKFCLQESYDTHFMSAIMSCIVSEQGKLFVIAWFGQIWSEAWSMRSPSCMCAIKDYVSHFDLIRFVCVLVIWTSAFDIGDICMLFELVSQKSKNHKLINIQIGGVNIGPWNCIHVLVTEPLQLPISFLVLGRILSSPFAWSISVWQTWPFHEMEADRWNSHLDHLSRRFHCWPKMVSYLLQTGCQLSTYDRNWKGQLGAEFKQYHVTVVNLIEDEGELEVE